MTVRRQLGQLLVEERLVTPDDLERALAEQRRGGRPLGETLVAMGALEDETLARSLASHLDVAYVDIAEQDIDVRAAALVPAALARRHALLPLRTDDDGALVVAMADPTDIVALDDLRLITDRPLRPVVAARSAILAAVERFGEGEQDVGDLATIIHVDEPEDAAAPGGPSADDAPVVRFVNSLIAQAVRDRASDIHLQPLEDELRVRFRIDGVLHEVTRQPRRIHPAVASRVKIMADLDIAERRVPQDGRVGLTTGGRTVDIRVSTLPTVHGETVVLRLLDSTGGIRDLRELGFLEEAHARYERSFRRPYGMIVVTGPTGSGKTTTLYATLDAINRPGINAITVEDPVEYRLPGISQVQIAPKTGLTFPVALRAILRQDPDVVLVGEMRDHETAQIGMEAALTGHLVLSTLHTNDAPSTVTRLTEMGIDPFLVASAVECVVAQRLARRLCERCRRPYQPSTEELRAAGVAGLPEEAAPSVYAAVGCAACARTGYRGRVALHEVLPVTEEIERLIVERAPTDDIAKFAVAQGMVRMREDGLRKVLLGLTTFEEVARVVA